MIGGKIDAAHAPHSELAILVEDGQALVPDAATLFRGDYAKDGQDLTISYGDGPDVRIIDYFATGFPPNLISPNGAQLRGETVVRLAGGEDTRLAQATGGAPTGQELADAIGQVETFEGTVTVTRANGNVVTLGDGDLVFQNDVVATGANSTLSLTFVDGTIFSLSAGSRMVLDELIYDANGSDNSAVFNLVQGGFVFIAGEVAPTGDMRIETPTGVLGIRGTTVEVVILTENGISEVLISLLTDPDGSVGQVEIRDLSGDLVAIVTEIDTTWVLSAIEGETREIPRADAAVANDIGLIAQTIAAFQTANARVAAGDTYVSQERSNAGGQDEEDAPDDLEDDPELPQNEEPEGGGGGQDDGQAEPETDIPDDVPEEQGSQEDLLPEGGDQADPPEDGAQDDAALDQATPEQQADAAQAGIAPLAQGVADAQAVADGQVVADGQAAADGQVEGGALALNALGDAPTGQEAQSDPLPEAGDQAVPLEGGALDQAAAQQLEGAAQAGAAALSQAAESAPTTAEGQVGDGSVSLNADGTIALAQDAQTAAKIGDAAVSADDNVLANDKDNIGVGQTGDAAATAGLADADKVAPEPVQQATFAAPEPLAPIGTEPVVTAAASTAFAPSPTFAFGDSETFDVSVAPISAFGDLGAANQADTLGGDPGIGDVSGSGSLTLSSFSDPIEDLAPPIQPVATTAVEDQTDTSPTPVNQPPSSPAGNVTFFADQTGRSGTLTASDPEGTPVTYDIVAQPTNGTVALDRDTGAFEYTPDPGFLGTDSFSYTATDANGSVSEPGVVTIAFNATNLDPVAGADAANVTEDGSVVVNLLANDSDPENGTLSLVSVGTASNGSVQVQNDGTVLYTPQQNFAGTDSFTYVLSDDAGGTTTGTATITVIGQNDAPTAQADQVSTTEDTEINIAVLSNDSDPENGALSISSIGTPSNGSAVAGPNGTINYTPDADFFGTDSFSYQISDPEGATASATVTVTVTPINDAPTIANDSAQTTEDTAVNIDVLANDTDPENGTITVFDVGLASNGTAILQADGSITYTPDANFSGFDSFTYSASDPEGATGQATVTVSIGATNDDPVATDDTAVVAEDGSVLIDVLGNDSDPENTPLSVQSLGAASSGTVAVQQDGRVLYTPDADFFGEDSFTYVLSDGFGGVDTGTVTVTVTPVNDVPTVGDDTVATNEDSAVFINVLANDVDPEGLGLTVDSVGLAGNGTAVLQANGTILYTPNVDFSGTDSFDYDAIDADGATSSGTVTVTVNAVNDAPVAIDDAETTTEDASVNIDLVANDSDADFDSLTVSSVGPASNGGVILEADGTVTYTPDADFFGTDGFSYSITDGNGGTSTATATVTVTAVNDAPVAAADQTVTLEETPVNIDVLANDVDVDGDTLNVTGVGTAQNGTVVLEQDGTVTYTPDEQYSGPDSFTYTVADGAGGTATGTVDVLVGASNDAPVPVADTASTDEDTPVAIDVLQNDSDPDGDTLSVQSASGATNGTVGVQQDGTVLYTPDLNFFGTDSFTYTVNDPFGGTGVGVVTVTVAAVNDAPNANPDTVNTQEDTAINLDVLANDSDPEGEALTLEVVGAASNGQAVLELDGTVTYIPDQNFSGTDSFDYLVIDDSGELSTGTVTVTVSPVDDAPVVVDETVSTNEDTPVNIAVLANDSDPEGGAITVSSVGSPSNGTAFLQTDGTITYTPDADFAGNDSFSYVVADAGGLTTSGIVNVTVTGENDAPSANDDTATLVEDTSAFINVLANDSDPEGNPLSVQNLGNPASGTAVLQQNGQVLYTPDANFFGDDSFTYTLSDGLGGVSVATVSITVTPENDAPVAVDDSATTAEDNPIAIDVLANDGDPENDALAVQSFSQGSNGAVSLQQDGTLLYAPDANFNGSDSFTYVVRDAAGLIASGIVSVTVTGENDAPVANNDTATVDEDSSVFISVIANDTDTDQDALVIDSVGTPSNGTAVITTGGRVIYTPDANFNGTDSFTYVVSDGAGGTDTGTVNVVITALNDTPVANPDAVFTPEDTLINIDALANDTDVDGDTITLQSVGVASNGTVALAGDGTINYTPDVNFTGQDSFNYTIADPGGFTAIGTVTVTIGGVNDPPDVRDDNFVTTENVSVQGDIFADNGNGADTDPEGGGLTLISATGPNGNINVDGALTFATGGSTLQINPDGTFVFNPAGLSASVTVYEALGDGESLTETFDYVVEDALGLQSTGTVSILVNGENDAPITGFDRYSIFENDVLTGNLLTDGTTAAGPDSDPEGDAFEITDFGGVALADADEDSVQDGAQITINGRGQLTLFADGAFTFDTAGAYDYLNDVSTLTQPFQINERLQYTVTDSNGAGALGVSDIFIQGSNDAPTAEDDGGFSTPFETATTISTAALLANDSDPESNPLTVTSVTPVSGGSVVINGASVEFTPDESFTGLAEFTYTVSDSTGETASASVFVNVVPPAQDIVSDFSDGLQGWTVNNDGTASWISTGGNPGGAARADDLELQDLYYWVAPSAYLGDKSAYSGGTLSFDLQATGDGANVDNQPDVILRGAGLTLALDIGRPSFFEFTSYTVFLDQRSDWRINGENGAVATEAQINEVLADLTSIEIRGEYQDGADIGLLDNVVLALPVPNQVPVAGDDEDFILAGTSTNIDVLANDSDVDQDAFTITAVSTPANGTAQLETDGTITYTPDAGFSGTDSFTYTVDDGVAGSNTATVTVRVAAQDAVIASNFDTGLDGWTVSDGVSELSWDAANGFIEANDDVTGDFFYFVAPTAYLGDKSSYSGGTLSFDLQAFSDGDAVNNGSPDVLLTGGGLTLAANIGRPSETEFTNFSLVLDTSENWRIGTEGGAAATQEQIDQVLADLTSLQIRGEYFNGLDEVGRLDNVSLSPPDNLAPVAQDDVLENTGNALFTFNVFDDNGNGADFDPEGGALTLVSVTNEFGTNQPIGTISQLIQPSGANIRLGADGTFQFFTGGFTTSYSDFERLDDGETLTSTFTYVVEDETGLQDTGNVSVTITGVNDRPIASDNGYSLTEDETVSGNFITDPGLGGVVDFDLEGTALTLVSIANRPIDTADDDPNTPGIQVTFGSGAILTVATDGSFTFDTNGAYDDITGLNINTGVNYQIADETGLIDTGFINFNIAPVNDDPVAVDDTISTAEDTSVTIDVLANDTDVDNDAAALSVDSFDQPTNGTVVLELDGQLTYTPNAGFSGTDTFDYTVVDGSGGSATATVSVNVTNTNVPPVAVEDTYTVGEDGFLDVPAVAGVLSNDNDADGDDLSVSLQSDVANGSLTLNADGSFDYTPDADFNGTDGFIYTLTDGAETVSGTVEIIVDPVNDPVVINAITGDDQLDLQEQTNPVQISGTAEVNGSVLISFGSEQQTVSTDANGNYSTTFSADVIPDATTVLVTVEATDEFGNDAGTNTRLVSIDQPSTDAVITVAGAVSNFDFPQNPGDFNTSDMPYEAIFDEIDANTFVERSLTINSATEVRWTADDGRTFAFVGTDLNYDAGTGLVTGLQIGSPTDPDFYNVTGLSNTLGEIKQIIADTIIPGGLDEAPFNGLFSQYAVTYNGSEGRDEIDFSGFSQFGDTYFGNGGDDEFWGGAGDDTYFGGAGIDFFEDWEGSNSFDGGAGDNDFVSYAFADGAVIVDLNAGTASKSDGTTDTLVNINGIRGSGFADEIVMEDGAEVNFAEGLRGNDTLVGGDGAFNYVVYNRESRFTERTTGVVVNIALGVATDLFGDTDQLVGFQGVLATEFNDVLTAGETTTALFGEEGDDRLISGAGDDFFGLGLGSDTVVFNAGLDFVDDFDAAEDALEFEGDALTFIDSLQLLDTTTVDGPSVFFQFQDDQAQTFGLEVTGLTIAQAEQIIDDLGLGGGTVIVDPDQENISGTNGDDIFLIQAGKQFDNRLFDASPGNDTYDFTDNTFSIYNQIDYSFADAGRIIANIDLNAENNSIVKENDGTDTLINAQSSANWGFGVVGTIFSDTYNIAHNTSEFSFVLVDGFGGQDTINLTGAGDSFLALFIQDQGAVTADLEAGSITAASGASYTLNRFGDTSQTRYELRVGDGDDDIAGSANDDRFVLGGGFDILDGAGGFDVIRYDRGNVTQGVQVNLQEQFAFGEISGAAFDHTLVNIEEARGSELGDVLIGLNSEESFLSGNGGNDTLVGGQARTGMRVGAGADSVVYSNGNDFILDFNPLEDSLEIAGVALANIGSLRIRLDDIGNGETAARLQFDIDDQSFFGINLDLVSVEQLYDILAPTYATFTSGVTIALSNGDGPVYGSPGDDDITLQGRVGDANERARASAGDDIYQFVNIAPNNYHELDYRSIGEIGIVANIDIDAAQSTITKGRQFLVGTDTLVGLSDAAEEGIGIDGTAGDNLWNIVQSQSNGGFLAIYNHGGDDVLNLTAGLGTLQFNFDYETSAVQANLQAGTASNANGDTWAINFSGDRSLGELELATGFGDDTIVGSDFNDRFVLRGGTDVVDGGAGRDSIKYDRRNIDTGVTVNLSLATAVVTGIWDGQAFSHSLSNIESVRGTRFDDTLTLGSSSGDLIGNEGNDSLTSGAGDDYIDLGAGNDTLVFTGGFDFVEDFDIAEDTLELTGAALANANSLQVYDDSFDGNQRVNFDFNDGNNDFQLRFKNITLEEGLQIAEDLGITGGGTINVTSGDQNVTGTVGNDTFIKLAGTSNDFEDTGFEASFGSDTYDFSSNRSNEYIYMEYRGLGDIGITANLNFDGPDSTVQKSTFGTDTLIGLQATSDAGFEIRGTSGDDVFNASLNSSNFTQLELGFEGGQDTASVVAAGNGRVVLKPTSDGIDVNVDLSNVTVDGTGFFTTADGDRADLTFTGDLNDFRLRVDTRAGDDSVIGSGLDDQFILRAGMDTVDGGGGFDTLRFDRSQYTTAINMTLGSGTVAGTYDGQAFTYNYSSIEGVRGSAQGDTLIAGAFNSSLEGRAGNDSIVTGIGDDFIRLGSGNDTLVYSSGFDYVDDFNSLDDTLQLVGAAAANTGRINLFEFDIGGGNVESFIEINDGNNTFFGLTLRSVFNTEVAAALNSIASAGVSFTGGNGDDEAFGSLGDDTIDLGSNDFGFDRAWASIGDDTYVFSNTTESSFTELDYGVLGVLGIDVVIDANLTNGTVDKGVAGTDTLIDVNNAFNDEGMAIVGTKGDDTFNITQGSATGSWFGIYHDGGVDQVNFDAGRGTLRLRIEADDTGVNADLGNGVITGNNGDVFNLNIFNVTDNFRLSVETGNGNDTILGTSSNEEFILGAGTDSANGGGGFDRIRYNRGDVDAGVNVDLQAQLASGTWDGQAFTHTLVDIDRVDGSRFADTIAGSVQNDFIIGRGGNDTISGGAGDDFIDATGGDVSLSGGSGNDQLFWDISSNSTASGGNDFDDVFFADSGSFDFTNVNVGSDLSGFERLNLENGNDTDNVTLTAQNVLDFAANADALLSTAFGDALTVIGDFGDQLTVTQGNNYQQVGTANDGDGRTLNVFEYSEGASVLAVVAVDEDVAVNPVA